jgi:hypothetical protein
VFNSRGSKLVGTRVASSLDVEGGADAIAGFSVGSEGTPRVRDVPSVRVRSYFQPVMSRIVPKPLELCWTLT